MASARYQWVVAAAVLLASCGGGTAAPVPGARYSANLPMPAAQASRAVLSFDVSQDGARIDYVLLEIDDLECAALSAEHSDFLQLVMAPITSGSFGFDASGVGTVSGSFVSADTARGTVTISYRWDEGGGLTNFIVRDPEARCDLGTFSWEATVGEHDPYPAPPSSPEEQPPSG